MDALGRLTPQPLLRRPLTAALPTGTLGQQRGRLERLPGEAGALPGRVGAAQSKPVSASGIMLLNAIPFGVAFLADALCGIPLLREPPALLAYTKPCCFKSFLDGHTDVYTHKPAFLHKITTPHTDPEPQIPQTTTRETSLPA